MNAEAYEVPVGDAVVLIDQVHGLNLPPMPDSIPPLSDCYKSGRVDIPLNNTFSKTSGSFGRKLKSKGLMPVIYLNSEGSAGSVSRRDVNSDRSDPNASKDGESCKHIGKVSTLRQSGVKRDPSEPQMPNPEPHKPSVLSELITRQEEPLHLQKAVPAFILLG